MTYQRSTYNQQSEKRMSEEQLDQIIDAILGGKYSWACVLLLRFVGYNPLHYIPYRTYNRLMKQNGCARKSKTEENSTPQTISQKGQNKIADLAYLDSVKDKCSVISGGFQNIDFSEDLVQPSSSL